MQEFLGSGLAASEIRADTDEERACAFFARELGGSTEDPWWEWACCDSFVLYFSPPTAVRPEPSLSARELALHEFGKQHRHFNADGTPILPRDAVLFNGGLYPGRVIELLSTYDGQGSYFPSSVMVDGKIISKAPQGKTREFDDGPRFVDLVLVERNSTNFMRVGLKYLIDKSEQGDPQALHNLGSLYKMGHGVKVRPFSSTAVQAQYFLPGFASQLEKLRQGGIMEIEIRVATLEVEVKSINEIAQMNAQSIARLEMRMDQGFAELRKELRWQLRLMLTGFAMVLGFLGRIAGLY